jgi:hypothetical protein
MNTTRGKNQMSSIEITKEKIIVKKRDIDGELIGLVFDKDELSEIILYRGIGEVFKISITEKTRLKIETMENHRFNTHNIRNGILRLEVRQEITS